MFYPVNENDPIIVGFNGPPHCGKDTMADRLADLIDQRCNIPVHRKALSMPMRDVVYSLIGETYTTRHYTDYKDVPNPLLGGDTIRQAMIALSENFVKPTYGKEYWAKFLVHESRGWWGKIPSVVLISDIGFQEETNFFEKFGKFLLVKLSRDGTDFRKDSRGYVHAGRVIDLENDTEACLTTIPEVIYDTLVSELGWNLQAKA